MIRRLEELDRLELCQLCQSLITGEHIPIRGIIGLHKIPDHWTNEEFKYWWCPVTDKLGRILQPARMSDEAKQNRLVMSPVENMLTNTGIALFLNNNSVSGQGSMYPFAQILSVGNGTFTGPTRLTNAVSGDGFTTGSRKAPASNSQVGLQSTITFNFGSGDAVGTWTNLGLYSYDTSGLTNATTTAGTGLLSTIAPFAFTKGASSYAVNYALILSN